VALASISIAGATATLFRRHATTVDPLHPEQASVLVTTGPNAVSRNPMYVGMAGLLVANSIRRGSWADVLPVAAFVLIIDRFQIRAEEEALLKRFGAEYDTYRASSSRWIGLPHASQR
jgi:protein-S-isoprenylcysteine O-methyltransferase Ste14